MDQLMGIFHLLLFFSGSTSFKALLKLVSITFFQKSLPGSVTDLWLWVPEPASQVSMSQVVLLLGLFADKHGFSQMSRDKICPHYTPAWMRR
jgi:hypothetical protein